MFLASLLLLFLAFILSTLFFIIFRHIFSTLGPCPPKSSLGYHSLYNTYYGIDIMPTLFTVCGHVSNVPRSRWFES